MFLQAIGNGGMGGFGVLSNTSKRKEIANNKEEEERRGDRKTTRSLTPQPTQSEGGKGGSSPTATNLHHVSPSPTTRATGIGEVGRYLRQGVVRH